MIRPFVLTDSFALRRLSGDGICLQSRVAFADDPAPLRRALAAHLLPETMPETMVVDEGAGCVGFLQLSHRRESVTARLRFLAPRGLIDAASGSGTAESLATLSGRRRAHYLTAEADPQSPAYAWLRREGFAVYARQTVWRREAQPVPASTAGTLALRPIGPADANAIANILLAVVPSLMQPLETAAPRASGWVLTEAGEVTGVFRCLSGSRGVWVEPFLHPSAADPRVWLPALLDRISTAANRPVYLCLRSYQAGLGSSLPQHGFAPFAEQALLARRLVVPAPAALPVQLPVAEASVPHATTMHPPLP